MTSSSQGMEPPKNLGRFRVCCVALSATFLWMAEARWRLGSVSTSGILILVLIVVVLSLLSLFNVASVRGGRRLLIRFLLCKERPVLRIEVQAPSWITAVRQHPTESRP